MARKRKAKTKAKKSKKAKHAAPARTKKVTKKAKPAKKAKAKQRVPKPTAAPLAASPLVPVSPTFGGKTEDQ